MASKGRTDRTSVKTYVPGYQKERWSEHADELDMSMSEFVRTMVQAGRRGFSAYPEEPDPADESPRGFDIKTVVQDILREGPNTWDDILALVTEEIEGPLEEVLTELQADNRVEVRPRTGEYTLLSDDE